MAGVEEAREETRQLALDEFNRTFGTRLTRADFDAVARRIVNGGGEACRKNSDETTVGRCPGGFPSESLEAKILNAFEISLGVFADEDTAATICKTLADQAKSYRKQATSTRQTFQVALVSAALGRGGRAQGAFAEEREALVQRWADDAVADLRASEYIAASMEKFFAQEYDEETKRTGKAGRGRGALPNPQRADFALRIATTLGQTGTRLVDAIARLWIVCGYYQFKDPEGRELEGDTEEVNEKSGGELEGARRVVRKVIRRACSAGLLPSSGADSTTPRTPS